MPTLVGTVTLIDKTVESCRTTVEEFLTLVMLKHDLASYVFTVLILFPVFLSFVFVSSKLVDKLCQTEPGRQFAHYLV